MRTDRQDVANSRSSQILRTPIKMMFICLYCLSNALIEGQPDFQVPVYMQHFMHIVLKRSVPIA